MYVCRYIDIYMDKLDKACIAVKPRYGGYLRGLVSLVYKFFDKEIGSGARAAGNMGANVNEVLGQQLQSD